MVLVWAFLFYISFNREQAFYERLKREKLKKSFDIFIKLNEIVWIIKLHWFSLCSSINRFDAEPRLNAHLQFKSWSWRFAKICLQFHWRQAKSDFNALGFLRKIIMYRLFVVKDAIAECLANAIWVALVKKVGNAVISSNINATFSQPWVKLNLANF